MDSQSAKALRTGAETAKEGATSILVILIVLSLLLAGTMNYYVIWMNTFQLMIHLPILNTVLPANAALFFNILCPIATYDVIGSDKTTEKIFNFDFKAHEKTIEDVGITD